MNICKIFFHRFSSRAKNLIPLTFVQDNSTGDKDDLTKFSELTLLKDICLEDELKELNFV